MKNRKTILVLSIALALLLSSCEVSGNDVPEHNTEIYQVVLRSETYSCLHGYLVILPVNDIQVGIDSLNPSNWEFWHIKWPRLEKETWDNFFTANAEPPTISGNLQFGCDYQVISAKEWENIWKTPNAVATVVPKWEDGVAALSNIGLNSQKNQALFLWSYSDEKWCITSLFFLENVGGYWHVVGRQDLIVC